jgi:two-component system sensor kinase FixL
MGLGLAIVRGLVEAHAGRVWLEDNPGGGAIFAFSLPAAPA